MFHSDFSNDLSAGFKLLNLKNGEVRKRYDSIKHAISRFDNIVMDLHIRDVRNRVAAANAAQQK